MSGMGYIMQQPYGMPQFAGWQAQMQNMGAPMMSYFPGFGLQVPQYAIHHLAAPSTARQLSPSAYQGVPGTGISNYQMLDQFPTPNVAHMGPAEDNSNNILVGYGGSHLKLLPCLDDPFGIPTYQIQTSTPTAKGKQGRRRSSDSKKAQGPTAPQGTRNANSDSRTPTRTAPSTNENSFAQSPTPVNPPVLPYAPSSRPATTTPLTQTRATQQQQQQPKQRRRAAPSVAHGEHNVPHHKSKMLLSRYEDRKIIDEEFEQLYDRMPDNPDEVIAMAKPHIEVELDYLTSLGGVYTDFCDETEALLRRIEVAQKKLAELHSSMGRNIPNKQQDPIKVHELSVWDPVLKEMHDFQDLVCYEHREKRRRFKSLSVAAQKQAVRFDGKKMTVEHDDVKQKRLVCKTVANGVAIYWKKIERFAWERMKRELQATLIEKKRMRLDKFVEDAIKLSITKNDNVKPGTKTKKDIVAAKRDNEDQESGVKTETDVDEAVSGPSKSTVKSETKGEVKTGAVDEDEFVVSEEMKRMEHDDAVLDIAMEKEEQDAESKGDHKKELNALEDDMNVPIEEILKRYREDAEKYQQEHGTVEESEEESDTSSVYSEVSSGADQGSDNEQVESKPLATTRSKRKRPEVQDTELGDNAEDQEAEFTLADKMFKEQEDEDKDLDEAISDEHSDNEDGKKERAKEITALEEEANMPIEALIAKYRESGGYDEQGDDDVYEGSTEESDARYQSDADVERTGLSDEEQNDASVSASDQVQVPPLIKAVLRPYQLEGLRWLASLYRKGSNGILADEMGLGKTLQTIALLAHLACDHGNWGPHLIVVPTSVLLNWEMEFKKFCPGFMILSYYGSPTERAKKRIGWNREYAFNVCIASYATVVQDAYILKRKSWVYMVLDEAQNIKNFNSKRWQTLLTFNTQGRLLLTGTPLQNSLQELWSLMHFILPDIFTSHTEFKEWFSDPLTESIEREQMGTTGAIADSQTSQLVKKLHTVLRPYLLRRLKKDVEKQMPSKYEHVIKCYLSRRQRVLYDEFITSRSAVEILKNPNYRSMLFVLMQLRKICNHPDQLQSRSVESPYYDPGFMEDLMVPSMFILPDSRSDMKLYHYETLSVKPQKPRMLPITLDARGPVERIALPISFLKSFGGCKVPLQQIYRPNTNTYDENTRQLPVVSRIPASKCIATRKSGGKRKIRLSNTLVEMMLSYDPYLPLKRACTWRNGVSGTFVTGSEASSGVVASPESSSMIGSKKIGARVTSSVENEAKKIDLVTPKNTATDVLQKGDGRYPLHIHNYFADGLREVSLSDGDTFQSSRSCQKTPSTLGSKIDSYNSVVETIDFPPANIGAVGESDTSVIVNRRELLDVDDRFFIERFSIERRPKPKSPAFCTLVQPTVDDVVDKHWWLLSRFVCTTGRRIECNPRRIVTVGPGGIVWNRRQEITIERVQTKLLHRSSFKYFKGSKHTIEHVRGMQKVLFPPRSLLHDDCGKFLVLGPLLKKLKSEGHRCLLYTQFSKMLDILENWINYMGFTYVRLDGSTKVDMRQRIVTRFNENAKIFLFISSTRAGGVGLTLTGADTVIFYDTDWNPAMDRQAMDRCHRIGQTREVNVYRLISEHTVEENIWRKQLQKRRLDDIVVDKGHFDTDTHNWFSNVNTLMNILKEQTGDGPSSSVDQEDIYGRQVLHESEAPEVDAPGGHGPPPRVVNMLAEAEDEDDATALMNRRKEVGTGNKDFQDFTGDIISTMPALVAYSIKLLLNYLTPTLIAQRDEMRLKIKVETLDSTYEDEGSSEESQYMSGSGSESELSGE
ncbi:Helicase SRCAP [Babesia sp. Xinjiang]|uniref:Helicase SRCAP n=1 Tax=Babesia sp. Xinjiang TaxID=462227 RepID=UPI000A22441C|nr:Helicase SRCAP [Babesia sp. Xinjiang]ORM39343.1 Helicase SRCAP [Babesia sp. Xinjiang]